MKKYPMTTTVVIIATVIILLSYVARAAVYNECRDYGYSRLYCLFMIK